MLAQKLKLLVQILNLVNIYIFLIKKLIFLGSIFLLENLRFHVEEEGSGIDKDGKKVNFIFYKNFYLLF